MIVLSGTIGAGKTSLTQLLADHLAVPAFYESVDDNPILPLFYDNPQQYGFLLQVYFLNKRLDQIKTAQELPNSVLDRSIFEDALLFKLNADLGRATQIEVDLYEELVTNMMAPLPNQPQVKDPSLLIHVRVGFDTMLARIQKRGRAFEQLSADAGLYDYYQELNRRYDDWFAAYNRSPKLQIDGDKYDFIGDLSARQAVIAQVDCALAEIKS